MDWPLNIGVVPSPLLVDTPAAHLIQCMHAISPHTHAKFNEATVQGFTLVLCCADT